MNQKNSWLFVILMACVAFSAAAQTTELSHYDKATATYSYPAAFKHYVARFEPEHAGFVSAISIQLNGPAGGTAEIGMYGHEGGTAFPQLEQELFKPKLITKKVNGTETIRVVLDSILYFGNTQFFVVAKNLSSGVQIMSDVKPAESACNSSSGGNYIFQFLKIQGDAWSAGTRKAFAVSVWIDYIKPYPNYWMKETTTAWGLDTNLSNRILICEDINLDGKNDLLIQGRLYLNNGISEGSPLFTDQSSNLGISGNPRAALAIHQGQEMANLYFLMHGEASYRWVYNKEIERYQKEPLNGFPLFESISSFSSADLNKDGYPDFFVGQLWGTYPEPKPNYLLISNSDGRSWSDRSDLLYPDHNGTDNFPREVTCLAANQNTWLSGRNTNRRSRGSQFNDYNNDGFPDLYVANYFLEEDEWYQNTGEEEFKSIIKEKGIDQNRTGHNHGTGVSFADFDGDGDIDLLLPQFAHPGFTVQFDHRSTTVYRNSGAPHYQFNDLKETHGIDFEETYAGGSWGDVNNDGLLDFVETVFYGCRYLKLFIQHEPGKFRLESHRFGLNKVNSGEDAVWADLNGDGLQDLIAGSAGQIRIFQNLYPSKNNWIRVQAINEFGHPEIGGKVYLSNEPYTMLREYYPGQGVRTQFSSVHHFGLGNSTSAEDLKVVWADGSAEHWHHLPANQMYRLRKGTGIQINDALQLLQYKNPTGDELSYSICSTIAETVHCSIYNQLGQEISSWQDVLSQGKHAGTYDIRNLRSGIYYFSVQQGSEIKSFRFVVIH